MDNMQVRKAHLTKLDDFVKTLYDECKVFSQYMNMKDLEILYLHIHELIEEMLQCKTSDEFMAMMEDLHKAVAGILIVVAPGKAQQVKDDMQEAHTEFKGDNFDDMVENLFKTSAKKYGSKPKQNDAPKQEDDDDYEEPDNDPEDLLNMLDLKEKAKKKRGNGTKESKDPMQDIYDEFKNE